MATLPTDQGGQSQASIVQISFKKICNTGSTTYLHLSAWLDALLLLYLLTIHTPFSSSILSVFSTNFFYYSWISSIWTHFTQLLSGGRELRHPNMLILLTAVCGNAERTRASLLTSPGYLQRTAAQPWGDSPMQHMTLTVAIGSSPISWYSFIMSILHPMSPCLLHIMKSYRWICPFISVLLLQLHTAGDLKNLPFPIKALFTFSWVSRYS